MPRLGPLLVPVVVLLAMLTPVGAQGPTLNVLTPASNSTLNSSDVTVDFEVGGFQLVPSMVPLAEAGKRPDANRAGEGHLHIMLDLQPVIVWEQSEPYTLRNVPSGEHQLMVELVNNDHSPLSPPVVQQIRFRTAMAMPETGPATPPWANLAGALLIAALSFLVLGRMLRGLVLFSGPSAAKRR